MDEPDPPNYDDEHERRAARLWKREHPEERASDLTEERKQNYRNRTLEKPRVIRLVEWFKRIRRRDGL